MKKYDAYLFRKDALSGITAQEAARALKDMKKDAVYPIEIGTDRTYAVGFITTEAAESLDFEYTEDSCPFIRAVRMMLDQPCRNAPDGLYCIQGLEVCIVHADQPSGSDAETETGGTNPAWISSVFCAG